MNKELTASLLVDSKCNLAEGIQWHPGDKRLYWSDIHGSQFWSCDESGGDVVTLDMPDRLCSFAFNRQGWMVLAFADGLYQSRKIDGERELIWKFEPDNPTTRMNDGRCDRQGRFIVGGMDEECANPLSQVVSYDGNFVKPLIRKVTISNSICFSPDGLKMYFADTPSRKIMCYEYDPSKGDVGDKSTFAALDESEGFPDGSCVDAEGAVWNARFGGSSVQRYLTDGTRDMIVRLPVEQVTCCCFGGENLDRLYITTARESMTEEQLSKQPESGGIFVVEPGVVGLPEDQYSGLLK